MLKTNLPGPPRTWAKGNIGYADLPGGLGYLRILRQSDYVDQPGLDA
ncbi:hypothetical protein [Nonomuraea endophytica]